MKPEPVPPERREQIEQLYHAALEREAEEREAFLAEACAGDEALQRKVVALVAAHEQAGDFIESPPDRLATEMLESAQLMTGRQLGHYQLLSLLGAGGMGQVYLARDTVLDRQVAIKVLPEHLAQDAEALARFKREAKAVAALSHPNILAIYDFGTEQGVTFAVTELLAGETLRSRLRRGSLTWREAVEIGLAIADGLAAAHAKEIIHRDLKPENIFLTEDGQVKILDFGLARIKRIVSDQELSAASTMTAVSRPGTVMGTVGYMSPEQVRGEEADAPSDLFSFGCVLYEMVTGQRPFARPTPQETLAAILKDDPPALAEAGRSCPRALEQLIGRCLEKAPEKRFQSGSELAVELRAGLNGSETTKTWPARPVVGFRPAAWVSVVLLAALAAALWWQPWQRWQPKKSAGGGAMQSIAVLPFKPLVKESRDESLEFGMADTLITRLNNLRQLTVRQISTVLKFNKPEQDPVAAGRELKVETVLDSNIQRAGDQIRVTVRLINVEDGALMWTEKFDEKFTNIFAVQDAIAEKVAGALALKLSGEERQRLVKRYTDNIEAYNLYLTGRSHFNRYGDGIRKSIDYYNQALKLDPNYALAYAGIAAANTIQAAIGPALPEEVLPKAKSAAEKAVALDDTLAEAHRSLAAVRLAYWDVPGAGREFKRMMELNLRAAAPPYHIYLALTGQTEMAVAEARRQADIDPFMESTKGELLFALYHARKFDEAIEFTKTQYQGNPLWLAVLYEKKGMYEQALSECQTALKLGRFPEILHRVGYVYAVTGKRAEAQKIAAELTEMWKQRYFPPFYIACVYAGLGDKDQAFAWLEKAYEMHDWRVLLVKLDQQCDSLRSDPRYTDLLRRLNLPLNQ